MIELEKRIENMKNMWFLTEPAYYIILASTKIEFSVNTNNISCGGGKIFVNEEFFNSIDDKKMAEYFMLECVRILLKHPYQRVLPDRNLAYIASNMLISKYVPFKQISVTKYEDVFGNYSWGYNGKCYEDIYNDLKDALDDKSRDGNNKRNSIKNISNGNSSDSLINTSEDCKNNTSAWDNDEVQKNLVDNIIKRIKDGNDWGTLPNEISSVIEREDPPKFDYRSVIRLFRKDVMSSKSTLTRMKPNRRYGFLEMGKKRAYTSNILIVFDTSGSMSDEEIGRYLGFVGGFFTYGFDSVDVVQFDVNVYDSTLQTFTKTPKFIKSVSRGGTVVDDILDYVNNRAKKRYGGVVICTDGGFAYNKSKWDSSSNETKYLFCINNRRCYETHKGEMKGKIKTTYIDFDVNNK